MDNISKRILEIRETKKIKQFEIAEKLNIEPSNYSRLEKRGEKLTIEQLKQIAASLGVGLNELLDIEVKNNDTKKVAELEKRIIILESTCLKIIGKLIK